MDELIILQNIRIGKYKSNVPYTPETRSKYHEDCYRLERVAFRYDALLATDLLAHPKAEKAWNMAWDRGHSGGLEDVYWELREIADLLL